MILYSTSHCHLCEQAEALLQMVAQARPIQWQVYDIVNDEALLARYGEKIPVLAKENGQELAWPFSLQDILTFID